MFTNIHNPPIYNNQIPVEALTCITEPLSSSTFWESVHGCIKASFAWQCSLISPSDVQFCFVLKKKTK